MKKEDSTLFKALLSYKKKGYTYITSESAESFYTGYDQAVQDFYEGTIDYEPNYIQWLHEYNIDVEDFVTFHNDLLVFGNKKLEKYDWENIELNKEYDDSFKERCKLLFNTGNLHGKEEWVLLTLKIRYVDCLAFAIWNLDLENESDMINDFSSINNLFNKPSEWDVSFGENCWNDSILLNFLNPQLWSDESFILELVKSKFFSKLNKTFILSEITENLKRNKEFVQRITEIDPQLVKFFDPELNTNKAIALKSLINTPTNLKMISIKLTSDPVFIKETFQTNPDIYQYLSEEFRCNKELASIAFKKDGKNLQYLPDSLKADKELLMIALNNSQQQSFSWGTIKSGELLEFTADEIKKDKSFILNIMKSNINCFQYVDETLRSDEEVMMTAINLDQRNFQYVTKEIKEEIKSNRSQLIKFILSGVHLKHFFGYQNKCTDKDLVMKALDKSSFGSASQNINKEEWSIISSELRRDRNLAFKLVLKYGENLQYLAEEFQNDKEFIIAAVSQSQYYYGKLDPIYRKDKDIAIAAIIAAGADITDDALKRHKTRIQKLLPDELFEHEEIKKILSQE